MFTGPMWRFYGGKFRAAPRYPKPLHGTIVEPFAGAAGYSCRYYDRQVILVDADPVIFSVWDYLIRARPEEILAIPEVDAVADLPASLPQEARWLVGFSMNDGTTAPCRVLSAGRAMLRARGRHFEGWCAARRERTARQASLIKHWRVLLGDWSSAPYVRATWFVDPPYAVAGKHYKVRLAPLDYADLTIWCLDLPGQAIVCEQEGATWLPFRAFGAVKAMAKKSSAEVIWTAENTYGP